LETIGTKFTNELAMAKRELYSKLIIKGAGNWTKTEVEIALKLAEDIQLYLRDHFKSGKI